MTASPPLISYEQHDDILVIKYEIPQITQYDLAEKIGLDSRQAVNQTNALKVVVDLSDVEFMSSVGYGPLVSLRSCVKNMGGRLVLCGLATDIRKMFDDTRLLINPNSPKSLFEHAENVSDSIELLSR